ncbi:MAG: DUF3089 domain-containing protein [Anaerotignum sp.]|nr:DUF3089 domain-containing protein [Anaerotignum sp.]
MSRRKRLRNISIIVSLILVLIAVLLLFFPMKNHNKAVEYSLAENWLALPVSSDMPVDVFYLYPTTYRKQDENDEDICEIENGLMRSSAHLVFNQQATAFDTVGNIYAPYYRQADAGTCLAMTQADREELLQGIPKTDVIASFDYYIKNYNNGRPFILAGHSQGSNMLLYLLSEYMKEHPDVYERMVAAYVIGYSVTDEYLAENPHLKFAEGADDTGVIISYNTQAPRIEGSNPVVLKGALVINPITWTRQENLAGAEENLGSILPYADGSVALDEDGTFQHVMNLADARVDTEKGVLICSTVDPETWHLEKSVFGKGVFHIFDYTFYYYSIRENATKRVETFLSHDSK